MDIEKLKEIVSKGETPKVDFKRELPRSDVNKNWGELIKDIIALTNGSFDTAQEPAYLIIGVTDDGKIKGISKEIFFDWENQKGLNQLYAKLNGYIDNNINLIRIHSIPFESSKVVVFEVPPTKLICTLVKDLNAKSLYRMNAVLMRRGDGEQTYVASPREALELERLKAQNIDNSNSSSPSDKPLVEFNVNVPELTLISNDSWEDLFKELRYLSTGFPSVEVKITPKYTGSSQLEKKLISKFGDELAHEIAITISLLEKFNWESGIHLSHTIIDRVTKNILLSSNYQSLLYETDLIEDASKIEKIAQAITTHRGNYGLRAFLESNSQISSAKFYLTDNEMTTLMQNNSIIKMESLNDFIMNFEVLGLRVGDLPLNIIEEKAFLAIVQRVANHISYGDYEVEDINIWDIRSWGIM